MSNKNIKVGQIFHSSWGYNMTLNSFYQVVELKGSSSVVLREIGKDAIENNGGWSGKEVPLKNSFVGSERLTKRIKNDRIKINDYASAYPHVEGESYYFNRMD